MTDKRILIGLTGPMAAGKNTAADILKEKGFEILDADVIAHSVLEKHSADIVNLYAADALRYGMELKEKTGKLNRKNLGRIIFRDKKKRILLENLIHPEVNAEAEKRIAESAHKSFVINAALLHKIALIKCCDFVLYIDAPFFLRFMRVRKRDRLPCVNIVQRFWAQRQIFAKCKKQNADIYRVGNSKTEKRLKEKLEAVLESRIQKG